VTVRGNASDLAERLQRYADGLVERGAIRTEPVRRAFATVPRHRFLPTFFYHGEQLRLLPGETPPTHLLDLVYENNSLLTHKGQDGDPAPRSPRSRPARSPPRTPPPPWPGWDLGSNPNSRFVQGFFPTQSFFKIDT
jgi:hypothetical protein